MCKIGDWQKCLKKVYEIFGRFKKSGYLCIAFKDKPVVMKRLRAFDSEGRPQSGCLMFSGCSSVG